MSRCLTLAVGLAALWTLGPAVAHADTTPPKPSEPSTAPRFSRHVAAVFSRLGCNGGTCHGAVKGQNGFRLSLFGADPALDHERLLREFGARRVSQQVPEASLLLLKATG